MPISTNNFSIAGVEKIYVTSKEIRSDLQAAMPKAVGVSALEVTCQSCNHSWTATKTNNTLVPTLGNVLIVCPECTVKEIVGIAQFLYP
jgi:ubiquitin C-terminal hydrolase